jgi:hypothetical protein
MPINTALASQVWNRYCYARDHGHNDFILKADRCERFFRGDQWDRRDVEALKAQLRPALTINKIISTIGNVMGEQIYNRSEIGFRPASGADPATAEVLTKVFKQISNDNQLDWRRSDMFADGIITSRGYLDVRMDFERNLQGEVRITNLNPKNVIVDPDAEEADPDTWNEVTTTKWLTADDIAVLYSAQDAQLLRYRDQSYFPYGYDSIEATRDRFADILALPGYAGDAAYEMIAMMRCLRVIERQHRVLDRQQHFIDPRSGDMRPVPDGWDRDRIALVTARFGWDVTTRLVKRIRWTVVCDNLTLHDDWSPYQHFTVVPYFPYFRHGKTIGLAENLIGPQELLNKVSSQELHVVNSSANSGWKVKAGALVNMSLEELEAKGAQSGLVLELADLDGAEKITPNSTPQGLDRISYKAEEHIKTISGITDSMQGQDREDVAAKAIQQKRAAANTNLAKPLDSLVRTDFMLARNILALVQSFYTDERILTIERAHGAGEAEQVTINQVTPEGTVANDLTVGAYDVVVSSVPQRETLEDSQFDQAVAMRRELGMAIPDAFIIESSRLMNKKDLLKQMTDAARSPEAQASAALAQRAQQAEVDKTVAETAQKQADARFKQARTATETVKAGKEAATPAGDGGAQQAAAEMALEQHKLEAELARDAERFEFEKQLKLQEFALKREEMQQKMALAAQAQAAKAVADRVAARARPQPPSSPPHQGA